MSTASKQNEAMGKRRSKPKKQHGARGQFSAHFRALLIAHFGDDVSQIAPRLGCSEDMVRKYLRGAAVPSIDLWDAYAKALRLTDWRDLFPPRD